MSHDSPTHEAPRPAGQSTAAGCLAVLSILMGILLLLAGLCALIFAAQAGWAFNLWASTIVLTLAGFAFIVGGVRIRRSAKAQSVAGTPGSVPEQAPQWQDVRDVGGRLILVGLILLLLFGFLVMS